MGDKILVTVDSAFILISIFRRFVWYFEQNDEKEGEQH